MGEERDWLYDGEDVMESIRRYEHMMEKNARYFFDVHEFEEIISYYIDINDVSKAVAAADYANRIHPASTAIQLKIAQILVDSGKAPQAVEILENLERIEESNYEVYVLQGTAYNVLGDIIKAKKYFDKALILTPDNKDEILCNIGISFEERGHYKIAIPYFLESYSIDNENVAILYDLAFCYDKINEYSKSMHYYEKYLDEDPFSDNAWFNLGTVYNNVQQFEKALEAYEYAIAINEEYGSAYYNKANVLSNLERYNEALLDYLEFLKIEENHVMTHCYIGECYEKLHRFDEGLEYFKTAVALDNDCADAWFGIGIIKMHQNLNDESLMYIQKSLTYCEENTEYLYALGLVYMRTNDKENAMKTFKLVTELDPTDSDSWLNLSELLLEEEKLEDALNTLKESYDENFNNAFINSRLAAYHFLTGNVDKGCIYLEQSLVIDPLSIDDLYEFFPNALKNITISEVIKKYLNLPNC